MYDDFNAREFDQMIAQLANDCEWINVPFGARFVGLEGFRQFLQGWVTAMPDCTLDVQTVRCGEDFSVAEFIGRGTHTGPLTGPAGTLEPTSRRVEVRFCEVVQVRGDKFTSGHLYFDAATLLRQIGAMPSEGVAPKKTEQPQARPH